MPAKLPFHEWCMILLFCAILLTLAGFALGGQKQIPAPPPTPEIKATVLQVKVEGQVAKPGLYSLPPNTSLKELVKLVEPLPSADLSQLRWRCRLRDGQTIHIPERQWITIQVTGAVQESGPLKILSGTRWCELTAEQLQVSSNADMKSLRRKRRFLKEGDLIEVPTKTSEAPSRKVKNKKIKRGL